VAAQCQQQWRSCGIISISAAQWHLGGGAALAQHLAGGIGSQQLAMAKAGQRARPRLAYQ